MWRTQKQNENYNFFQFFLKMSQMFFKIFIYFRKWSFDPKLLTADRKTDWQKHRLNDFPFLGWQKKMLSVITITVISFYVYVYKMIIKIYFSRKRIKCFSKLLFLFANGVDPNRFTEFSAKQFSISFLITSKNYRNFKLKNVPNY
jgi:hypothetical protein